MMTGQVNRLSGSVKEVRNSEIIPSEFNGEESLAIAQSAKNFPAAGAEIAQSV
jgi:hypothetical protein